MTFAPKQKNICIRIKTAPYLATTCKELFFVAILKNLKIRGSDFAILVAIRRKRFYTPAEKIFVKLLNVYPKNAAFRGY